MEGTGEKGCMRSQSTVKDETIKLLSNMRFFFPLGSSSFLAVFLFMECNAKAEQPFHHHHHHHHHHLFAFLTIQNIFFTEL